MRVEYLKLENFKGIWVGMRKKIIEIDFSESAKQLILLIGRNGSGKSCIMSMLHPFPESFDSKRSSIILDDKSGYKEIHISNNDAYYIVMHHYGKKNKSFITRIIGEDETELNPAGGIRTFYDVVKTELGVTPDHFKLIRVGSNSDNIIDLNSSQRKQFMGKFTPSIQEYLDAYKVVNDKLNTSAKEIRFLVDELSKLDDIEKINSQIKIFSNTLKSHAAHKQRLETAKAKLLAENKIIDEDVSQVKDELVEFNRISFEITTNISQLETLTSTYPKLANLTVSDMDEKIKATKEKITSLKKSVTVLEKEVNTANTTVVLLTSNLSKYKSDLRKYSVKPDRSIDVLRTRLDTSNNQLLTLQEQLQNNFEEYSIDKVTEDLQQYTSNDIRAIQQVCARLVAAKNELSSTDEFDDKYILGLLKTPLETLNEKQTEIQQHIVKLEADADRQTRKVNKLNIAVVESETTKTIANMCSNTKCKVYQLREQVANTENELAIEVAYQEVVNTELLDHVRMDNIYRAVISHHSTFHSIPMLFEMNETLKLKKELYALLLQKKMDYVEYLFNAPVSVVESLFNFDKCWTMMSTLKKAADLEISIQNTTETISNYANSEALTAQLNTDVTETIAALEKATTDANDKNAAYQAESDKCDRQNSVLDIYTELKLYLATDAALQKELAVYSKIFEKNKTKLAKQKENLEELDRVSDQIEEVIGMIDELNESVLSEKLKLSRIAEFNTRKEALLASKEKLQIVKEAIDIKTGIPLHILGGYLDEIKHATNDLLALVFDNDLEIDFSVTDSDFSIPVYQNGVPYNDDVTSCSQGETALIKCCLSLGITSYAAKLSHNKYNIVCLDEIDAELDKSKRLKFMDILSRQLAMLNSEQCFVVTHNDAFQTADIGMILLPDANVDTDDADFMANKEIIGDFRTLE